MSTIKFSFGSNKTPSASTGSFKQTPKPKPALTHFDDADEDASQGPTPAGPSRPSRPQNRGSLLLPTTSTTKLSRQQKLQQEQAAKLDASVFEYDEVYDDMKQAEQQAKLAKDQKGAERKPQYISGLIETAKQRQIDRVRAEDKMVQREREAEGVEFEDKDAFVTPAYLAQQEELRKAEEAERLKAEQQPAAQGMTSFYKNILDEDAKRHEAAVQAVAARKAKGKGNSLGLAATLSAAQPVFTNAPQPQYDPEPEAVPNEAKLAAEVGAKLGRKVDLDDEGRIVDHRQLLSGGLNIGPPKVVGPQKPKKSGFALPIAERARQEREKAEAEAAEKLQREEEEEDGELSQAEKVKLSRERQSLLLQQQLLELESNKRKAEEEAKVENAKKVARRNDESRIEALRLQALERRKAREQARKNPEADALVT